MVNDVSRTDGLRCSCTPEEPPDYICPVRGDDYEMLPVDVRLTYFLEHIASHLPAQPSHIQFSKSEVIHVCDVGKTMKLSWMVESGVARRRKEEGSARSAQSQADTRRSAAESTATVASQVASQRRSRRSGWGEPAALQARRQGRQGAQSQPPTSQPRREVPALLLKGDDYRNSSGRHGWPTPGGGSGGRGGGGGDRIGKDSGKNTGNMKGGAGKGMKAEQWELLKWTVSLALALAQDNKVLMSQFCGTALVKEEVAGTLEGAEAARDYQAHYETLPKPTPKHLNPGPPHLQIFVKMLGAFILKEKDSDRPGWEQKCELAKRVEERLLAMEDPEEASQEVGFFRLVRIKDEGIRKIQWKAGCEDIETFIQWFLKGYAKADIRKGTAPNGRLERLIAKRLRGDRD